MVFALAAFRAPAPAVIGVGAPADASRLLPAGPPEARVIAVQDTLRLQLPIHEREVTAIAYHDGGEGSLALDPIGRQANEGLFSRLYHRIFGGGGGEVRYYRIGGGLSAIDVGAAPGTDVYAPVDGTVVGVRPYVISGKGYGSVIEIQPSGSPSLIVTMTHLRADPGLTVGSQLTSATTKVGTVVDLARVERQALARFTQDAGNHVALAVRSAAALGS